MLTPVDGHDTVMFLTFIGESQEHHIQYVNGDRETVFARDYGYIGL